MTEAGWTREKPTAAGWYWNRINGTVGIALIMRRDCQLYAWLRFKDAWLSREGWLDYIHGEWLGPISPTDRQQGRVEGLREAAIICRERGKPHDIEWWMTASKKEVSAQTAIDCAELIEQLAQQAQGEKGVGDDHR